MVLLGNGAPCTLFAVVAQDQAQLPLIRSVNQVLRAFYAVAAILCTTVRHPHVQRAFPQKAEAPLWSVNLHICRYFGAL